MDYRIVYIPPFTAVTSGVDREFDFSPNGKLGKFNNYFSAITPSPRDSFMPRDFLFYNKEAGGLEWWWAIVDGMPDGGFEKVEFDGGYYLTYNYRDGDNAANEQLYAEAMKYISESDALESDERPQHYACGHIITPVEVIKAQGFALMEAMLPIRVKKQN